MRGGGAFYRCGGGEEQLDVHAFVLFPVVLCRASSELSVSESEHLRRLNATNHPDTLASCNILLLGFVVAPPGCYRKSHRGAPCWTRGRCIALAFRVLSSDLKFAEIIVDGGAVGALIALTRSADAPCRLRCGLGTPAND